MLDPRHHTPEERHSTQHTQTSMIHRALAAIAMAAMKQMIAMISAALAPLVDVDDAVLAWVPPDAAGLMNAARPEEWFPEVAGAPDPALDPAPELAAPEFAGAA